MAKPSSFVLLLLLQYLMTSLALTDTNITTDKYALLAFKSSITSDPYNFLANWSVSSSPCNWVGVTCINAHHVRVHSLKLAGMDLKGTISPQLGNLSFLVEVDLSNNNLNGQIPAELVKLHRLRLFNLSYNDFHGQVPTWIGDLSTLEHLNLQNNTFDGSIPPSLFNLTRLEILDWNSNLIEGTIPVEIGRLERLKILRLSRNKLLGIISQTISNLSSLELLHLSYNTFSGDIPNEVGDLSQLKTLYLGVNQLVGSIPSSLFNSSMLQYIALDKNQLSGILPTNVCLGLPKLELFYVDGNDFSGEIPAIWHHCKELAELELGDNVFNPGIIPSDIGNLTNLQLLYLANSNLQAGKIRHKFQFSSSKTTTKHKTKELTPLRYTLTDDHEKEKKSQLPMLLVTQASGEDRRDNNLDIQNHCHTLHISPELQSTRASQTSGEKQRKCWRKEEGRSEDDDWRCRVKYLENRRGTEGERWHITQSKNPENFFQNAGNTAENMSVFRDKLS
ncbi:leucine-rich repeat receptor-like serine/threonine-protein kinase SKM1 [Prosopis cineraria]|uniref:leucine-rich repeat receptor-like serine/threonine-protein kinase SKM1 n=1 Tax=Prosopis cineraria TaxID=364024 RepID=UPI0024108B33|nr:leucine-rich repeat receptor-like serine/threonine-protein kinase SKM1 [Prosopis cineraria]